MRFPHAITIVSAVLLLSPAMAATITISNIAPTIDGADIGNLSGGFDAGGDEGHMWGNRPHQGQSFTTGSNPGGYQINSVTLRSRGSSGSGSTFNVVVGSLSGGIMTQVGSTETAVTGSYVNGSYITFNFDTPLTLNASTTYGFLWGSNAAGFITDNTNNDTAYTGGTGISSGDDNMPDLNNVIDRNVDRVFHVDLVAVPEPSAALLGLLGGCLLLRRRR